MSVGAGRTVGIVGESGSGKSMLTRTVLGLAPAGARVTGSVRLAGEDITSPGPAVQRRLLGARIAVVFQDPMTALNPVVRIGRQLTEPMRFHLGLDRAAARARAADLLAKVGVPDPDQQLRQYPHQLSGGMRQRVTIAAALSCDPEILFADEATTALDVTVQKQILDLLTEVQRDRDMALVLISHDLGVIAGRTDDVFVMYGGRLVERAPTEVFFTRHRHRYSAALVDSIVRRDHPRHGEFRTIPGRPPVPGTVAGCPFAPRCPAAGDECRESAPPLHQDTGDARLAHRCLHPVNGDPA
ncbi:ABC transporter ATP-binding protein [Amycolatopsis sp. FDAARGOS 1241]|nr:ABC transporter ATP-binding protein [Amycolatopsis sp. FDAARGOS 1241]